MKTVLIVAASLLVASISVAQDFEDETQTTLGLFNATKSSGVCAISVGAQQIETFDCSLGEIISINKSFSDDIGFFSDVVVLDKYEHMGTANPCSYGGVLLFVGLAPNGASMVSEELRYCGTGEDPIIAQDGAKIVVVVPGGRHQYGEQPTETWLFEGGRLQQL